MYSVNPCLSAFDAIWPTYIEMKHAKNEWSATLRGTPTLFLDLSNATTFARAFAAANLAARCVVLPPGAAHMSNTCASFAASSPPPTSRSA